MKHKKYFFTIFFGLIFSLVFFTSANAQGFPGPLTLFSQENVEYYATNLPGWGFTYIAGNLTITDNSSGTDITNLTPLYGVITSVTGDLVIETTPALTDLDGLESITSVGGKIYISQNSQLTNLDGLASITSVGTDISILQNDLLTDINGLGSITSVSGGLHISYNAVLTNLGGLEYITSVGGNLAISQNNSLTNLDGLASLTSVGGNLEIAADIALTDIDGLASLSSVDGQLVIYDNDALTSIDGLATLSSIGDYDDGDDLQIDNNALLTNLDALKNLTTVVGQDLTIVYNPALVSFCGLYPLLNTGGTFYVSTHDNGANPTGPEILAGGPCVGGGDVTVVLFQDDFESYTAGQRLACQNSIDWNTWSLLPCNTIEDPYISSSYASSGSKSVVIIQDNDLIKPLGDVTTGYYLINFRIYIPSGKTGYFNTLSGFTGGAYEWAMECYFDTDGGGRLFAGETDPTTFAFAYNSWQEVAVLVNLDTDVAEFWFNGSMIHSWQWTLGVSGLGSALMLAANDFYGTTANNEMYIDDYRFVENPGSNILVSVDIQPETCPNSLGIRNKGAIPVAILGTDEFDVQNIDPVTVKLEGISPLRWVIKDVATPGSGGEECDCTIEGPDGYDDLNLKFDTQEVIAALGEINDGDELVLTITGEMLDETPIEGSDCVIIRAKGPRKDLAGNLSNAPEEYALFGNYPNPFNPNTTIKFAIPEESFIKLEVYNTLGERVNTLVAETLTAGIYSVDWNGTDLSSGIYIYRLQAGSFVETKKMILLR